MSFGKKVSPSIGDYKNAKTPQCLWWNKMDFHFENRYVVQLPLHSKEIFSRLSPWKKHLKELTKFSTLCRLKFDTDCDILHGIVSFASQTVGRGLPSLQLFLDLPRRVCTSRNCMWIDCKVSAIQFWKRDIECEFDRIFWTVAQCAFFHNENNTCTVNKTAEFERISWRSGFE